MASEFLPRILRSLGEAGVLVRGDERTVAFAASARSRRWQLERASEEDWGREYLAPIIAVGVVDSLEQAIEHVGATAADTPRRS